MAVVKIVRR